MLDFVEKRIEREVYLSASAASVKWLVGVEEFDLEEGLTR